MSDTEFSPELIRERARQIANELQQATTKAKSSANKCGSISLPQFASSEQLHLNSQLNKLPSAIQMLQDMVDIFQETMYDTASSYEHTESQNTTTATKMQKEVQS